jgi:hypothetical protein
MGWDNIHRVKPYIHLGALDKEVTFLTYFGVLWANVPLQLARFRGLWILRSDRDINPQDTPVWASNLITLRFCIANNFQV